MPGWPLSADTCTGSPESLIVLFFILADIRYAKWAYTLGYGTATNSHIVPGALNLLRLQWTSDPSHQVNRVKSV